MNDDFIKLSLQELKGQRITPRFISVFLNMEMSDSIELFNEYKETKKKEHCEDCE